MTPAYIPYGAYWSTPFAKWQGSFAHLHSLKFAAHVARHALAERNIDASRIDMGVLGSTVPQPGAFYGLPWVATMMGAPHLAGPHIAQACATSARCLAAASQAVADGTSECALVITADRISNGPQIYYPNPLGPGGTGENEAWVLANIEKDPATSLSMLATAENVASKYGISTQEQNEVVLRRYHQYQAALENGSAFLGRFMALPFDVPNAALTKTINCIDGDEGVFASTPEGLARLRPVAPGGSVTYGGQTHPADGNAGMLVTSRERAREFSSRPEIQVRILGFGQARAEPAFMPYAPIPAARQALERAQVNVAQLNAVKTHNPFVINDIALARETGLDAMQINNYGSSLIWGHPQGPTGLRSIMELIEELELQGGGIGLFTGCAAGDSAMAVVIKVEDARR